MKSLKALGLLGEMEAARAAMAGQDSTAADLVVGLLTAAPALRNPMPLGKPTWVGIDPAAPDGEVKTP